MPGEFINDVGLQEVSIALEHEEMLLAHILKHFSRLVDLGVMFENWLA